MNRIVLVSYGIVDLDYMSLKQIIESIHSVTGRLQFIRMTVIHFMTVFCLFLPDGK